MAGWHGIWRKNLKRYGRSAGAKFPQCRPRARAIPARVRTCQLPREGAWFLGWDSNRARKTRARYRAHAQRGRPVAATAGCVLVRWGIFSIWHRACHAHTCAPRSPCTHAFSTPNAGQPCNPAYLPCNLCASETLPIWVVLRCRQRLTRRRHHRPGAKQFTPERPPRDGTHNRRLSDLSTWKRRTVKSVVLLVA